MKTLTLSGEVTLMYHSAAGFWEAQRKSEAIEYCFCMDWRHFWPIASLLLCYNINPNITGKVKFHLVVQIAREKLLWRGEGDAVLFLVWARHPWCSDIAALDKLISFFFSLSQQVDITWHCHSPTLGRAFRVCWNESSFFQSWLDAFSLFGVTRDFSWIHPQRPLAGLPTFIQRERKPSVKGMVVSHVNGTKLFFLMNLYSYATFLMLPCLKAWHLCCWRAKHILYKNPCWRMIIITARHSYSASETLCAGTQLFWKKTLPRE